MAAGRDAIARGLDADHPNARLVDERRKQAGRVRAAADARDQRVGQPPRLLEDLPACLAPDHGLEVAHHPWIRMRPGDRADQVERVADIGDPVSQRLVHRVLERPRAALDRMNGRAEQLHALDVERLAHDILGAHVDLARQAEQCGDGRGGDAVLAGTGLGDQPALAHPAREDRLADAVVDLVRARVIEVLALEVDLGADLGRQAARVIEERRPADIVREQSIDLGPVAGVGAGRAPRDLELRDRRHQRLGDVLSAELAEPAARRLAELRDLVGGRHRLAVPRPRVPCLR